MERTPPHYAHGKPREIIWCVTLAGLILLLAGCNGPMAWFPGGAMKGPEASATDWPSVIGSAETLDLETRPEDPYSVRVGFVLRDGQLYIDPAEERRWYAHLAANSAVRVRFSETIYPARAVAVTDPEELAGFDPTRRVFRLEPGP